MGLDHAHRVDHAGSVRHSERGPDGEGRRLLASLREIAHVPQRAVPGGIAGDQHRPGPGESEHLVRVPGEGRPYGRARQRRDAHAAVVVGARHEARAGRGRERRDARARRALGDELAALRVEDAQHAVVAAHEEALAREEEHARRAGRCRKQARRCVRVDGIERDRAQLAADRHPLAVRGEGHARALALDREAAQLAAVVGAHEVRARVVEGGHQQARAVRRPGDAAQHAARCRELAREAAGAGRVGEKAALERDHRLAAVRADRDVVRRLGVRLEPLGPGHDERGRGREGERQLPRRQPPRAHAEVDGRDQRERAVGRGRDHGDRAREVERAARRTRHARAPGERDAAVYRDAGRARAPGADREHEVHLDRLPADAERETRGHLRAGERGPARLERVARGRERQRAVAVGELERDRARRAGGRQRAAPEVGQVDAHPAVGRGPRFEVEAALPTRSSPLAVAPDGHVFVVNPDSSSVARLDLAAPPGRLTHERAVGQYPRTLALDATHVFTAGQKDDTLWRLDQADLGSVRGPVDLGFGCAPYGVAVTPAGARVLVTCQGTSDLVILDTELATRVRIRLPWPNARAIAVASDGGAAYVSHYLTEEPGDHAHVSVVDLANKSVARVFAVAPDTTTCETQNSGQGALNLVSAIALMPEGAPPESANQLWIGGTQQNNLSKGLFKRSSFFADLPGASLFPGVTFRPFPTGGVNRDVYRASFHDITRFGIYKLDATDGHVVGKLDIDEASNATDIELSPDGTTAYVVDLMFNSYHIFSTKKGQGADVTTLFASPSAFGPGGADPSRACVPDAQRAVAPENPFRLTPQAQVIVIDGYDPVDTINTVVATGLDFDAATYITTGRSRMRKVADGVGTAPIGVRLAPDGRSAYVANYLARNVVRVAAAAPLDAASGLPDNLRCIKSDFTRRCGTNNDCPASTGFCNHPGGAACAQDADCSNPPCVRGADC